MLHKNLSQFILKVRTGRTIKKKISTKFTGNGFLSKYQNTVSIIQFMTDAILNTREM